MYGYCYCWTQDIKVRIWIWTWILNIISIPTITYCTTYCTIGNSIAREAGMGAGIPISVPSHTVAQACISSNVAISSCAEKILAGQADICMAGGAETFSDVPIRYSRNIRKRMLKLAKVAKQGLPGYLSLLKGLTLKDFAPEAPAIANYTTGEVMVSLSMFYLCVYAVAV